MKFVFIIFMLMLSSLAESASALNYSGRLVNPDGSPVSGPVSLRFELLYNSNTSNVLCTKELNSVQLSQGVFHAKLNFTSPECSGASLTQVLANVAPGDSVVVRVTDTTPVVDKVYGLQSLDAMPFAMVADHARSLGAMGATTAGQVLRWNGSQWTADTIDEVAAGSIGTPELSDNSVTSAKIVDLTITGADIANGSIDATKLNLADNSIDQTKIAGLAASFTGKENALGTATSSEYLAGDRAWRNFQNDVRATFVGMGYAPIVAGGSILSTDTLVTAIAKLDGRITNAEAAQTDYVSLAGDTMSGPLILNADPSVALGAATKQYVDAQITAVSAGSSQWDNVAGGLNYDGGRVGIGVAAPTNKLSVDSGAETFPIFATSSSNRAGAILENTVTTGTTNTTELRLRAFDGTAVDTIGQIVATDGNYVSANSPANSLIVRSIKPTGQISFQVGGALVTDTKMVINSAGNVGVGTNSPAAKLDVAGSIKISGGAPGVGKVLTSDATGLATWETPAAAGITDLTGDVTGTGPGATATTIAPGAVTYAKTNFANGEIPKEKINNLVTDLAGKEPVLAAGTTAQYYRGDKTWQTLNTTAVPEGTNLYFTEPRVLGTSLAGFTANTSQVDVTSADSALVAFQKLQSSINAILTGSVPFENNINLGGFRATNLAAPTAATDAATKAYVDSLASAGASKWANVAGGINYGSGNVGIGTTTPNAFLDVRGNIKSEIPGTNSVLFMNFNPSTATPGLRVGVPVGPATIPSANYITAGSFDVNGNMRATGPGTTRGLYVPINTQSTSSDYGVDVVMNGSNYSTPHGFKASVAHTPTGTNSAYGFYADVTNSNGSAYAFYANNGMSYFNGLYLYNNGTNSEINTANGGSIILGGRRMVDLAQVTNIPTIRLRPNVTGPGVGIGVPEAETLEAPLHIKSAGGAAVTTALLIGSSGNSGAGRGQAIVMRQPNSNSVGRDALRFTAVDDGLRIATGAGTLTDHMRIDAAGNTGFGIMLPTTKLHVAGSLTLGNGNETCAAGNFAGAIRYVGGAVEFCNGAAWTALASAGGSTPGDNTVTSAKIADGSIVDADVAAGAAIAQSKIANLTTDLSAKQPLDADLTALAGVATNGVLVRTGAGTAVTRSLAGTANRVNVTNADGVAGNPTVDVSATLLPSPLAGDFGRVLRATGANTAQWQALASGDITAALGFTPINKAGDTMPSGVFDFTTSSVVRVLNPVGVTDVANKQYVDSQISGAANQWTQASGNVYRATGNVGIGTTTPNAKLEVMGGTDPVAIRLTETTGAHANWELRSYNTAIGGGNNQFTIWGGLAGSTQIDRFVIDPEGRVGIGTLNPNSLLSIGDNPTSAAIGRGVTLQSNSTSASLRIMTPGASPTFDPFITFTTTGQSNFVVGIDNNSSNDGVTTAAADDHLFLGYNGAGTPKGTSGIRVTTSGNVGIGTTTPAGRLDVAGNIVATSVGARNNSITTPAAGWYRVARLGGDNGRGECELDLYTFGGSREPTSSRIRFFNNWSTASDVSVESVGGPNFWTEFRVTNDGTSAYLEANFAAAITELRSRMVGEKGNFGCSLYSGALPAGGGTVQKTIRNGLFAMSDRFLVEKSGNIGVNSLQPLNTISLGSNIVDQNTSGVDRVYSTIGAQTTGSNFRVGSLKFIQPDTHYQDAGALAFFTAYGTEAERMRIDPLGNVGIGTSTPAAKLHISSAGSFAVGALLEQNSSVGGSPRLALVDTKLGSASTAPAWMVDNSDDRFRIFRQPNISTGGTVFMTVLNNGRVGIGTDAPGYTLHVNGSVAGTSAYVNLSDASLKRNVLPVQGALDSLLKLRGVSYEWRREDFPEIKLSERRELGVIAQEVEKVYPEAVTVDDKGTRSVAYSMLIAPIIESIRELWTHMQKSDAKASRQIASVKGEQEVLKNRVERLERENAELKAYLCYKDPKAPVCRK